MHITKKIQKAERRFDTRAEWFLWHHPVLGYLFVLIGMPLLVLLCVCAGALLRIMPLSGRLGYF